MRFPILCLAAFSAGLAARDLSGTWSLVPPSPIPQAIAAGVKDMNFLVRPIARARIEKVNEAYPSLRIQVAKSEVSIGFQDGRVQRLPLDGTQVPWIRQDGEKMAMSARLDAGTGDLVQVYHAHDGVRTNVFHLDPDQGTLDLTVKVESPRLPHPITYTLIYRAGD